MVETWLSLSIVTLSSPPTTSDAASSPAVPSILHLFYNLTSDSESENSEDNELSRHEYKVLEVPETISVPYKLRSWKTSTTQVVPGSSTAREMASLPLKAVYKEILALFCTLEKWKKEISISKEVLAILPPFGRDTTRVDLALQKVKIKAILDNGSPVNVVSYKLMKKLKLAPDLTYNQSYGTSGLSTTCAIRAYSALSLRFGKLLLSSPAVFLENESCDLLIGTQFLWEYNSIINLKERFLSLLNYNMFFIFEEHVCLPGKKLKTFMLEYPTGIFSLKFRMHSYNLKSPLGNLQN
ncbi:hypothetical protein DSO57_1008602 [Entomophthora muscae]|uniref:Uncharacterized protein n=1 Tax=Entomophthora muscae TaxID=34485 RepID=A0ACC2S8T2_9FUNG|nr:hypothetical protein DSO57_1008602 [Entomophthora muscae]